jgi:hypothetical protein
VGAAEIMAELSEVSCGDSYQVDATELMAEARRVETEGSRERVAPGRYAVL